MDLILTYVCVIYINIVCIHVYRNIEQDIYIEIFQTLILILQGIENLTSVLVHHVHFAAVGAVGDKK